MEERLEEAARAGDVRTLYSLMSENAYLFERIDAVPFIDTPLHVAASEGQLHFAMEIMRLKPSFARKLNQKGYTPINLALQKKQTKLVLRLLDVDPDLARAPGQEGKTPLHYAAEHGMVDLLAEFLTFCPKSILDLTIRKETALHVAVKSGQVEALKVLLGWLEHVGKDAILNWRDDEGDTILHVAAKAPQIQSQMVKLLLIDKIDINERNLENLTALDIIESRTLTPPDNIIKVMLLRGGALNASLLPTIPKLEDTLRSKMSWREKSIIADYRKRLYLSNEDRNIILLVAVLFATANYQAALSFLSSDSNSDYDPNSTSYYNSDYYRHYIMHNNSGYYPHSVNVIQFVFKNINNLAFFASMVEIFLHLPSDSGILRLVLPLVVFNFAVMNLESPAFLVIPVFLLVVYHHKLALILHKYRPAFVQRKVTKMKMAMFKRCSSLNRELPM